MAKQRPVIWKRSISTRAQRERAWAKKSLERERALAKLRGPSLFERVRRLFSRGR
jgi:hypothetical protein